VGGIGVTVAENAEPGRGLRILKVLPGSPAAAAGIAAGDFLVRVKGEEVRRRREARMLMFGRAGTKVELSVRKGKRIESLAIERVPIEGMTAVER
jgi:C-terminal processing protease CtpA/Prc